MNFNNNCLSTDGMSEIGNFFTDKSVFITGATGFLGKVLVEKLIRSCAEVKHIYILIRSKRGKNVDLRLRETLDSEIFDRIRESNSIALKKVVAIEGDITLPGLGIHEHHMKDLIENVSTVFHSAATVRFDGPLKTAIDYNVLGTKKVVELCYKLPKLLALIHVSTAYSNGNRRDIDEIVYPSKATPQEITFFCQTINKNDQEQTTTELLYGHANTYTFSKGLAEQFLAKECQDLPIAIIRPSIVAASWLEPFKGWVEGKSSLTGLMFYACKGYLRHGLMKPSARADLIPVDTVVNLMIALVWFTATKHPKGIQVYNCTSGSINPIFWAKVIEKLNPPNSTKYPSSNIFRYPSYSNSTTELGFKFAVLLKEKMLAYLLDAIIAQTGRKKHLIETIQKMHNSLCNHWWFSLRDFQFSNKNLSNVYSSLCETDKTVFNFDIRALDWDQYFDNYWFGTRKFCLKEETSTLEEARAKLNKIYYRDKAMMCLMAVILVLFICLFYCIVSKVCLNSFDEI